MAEESDAQTKPTHPQTELSQEVSDETRQRISDTTTAE